MVADPARAAFLIFKATGQDNIPPRPAMGTPGFFEWNELYGGDPEASFAFYAGLFGWTKNQSIDMGAMGVYQTFDIAGVWSGGMMKTPPEMPMPCWVYYVAVDDIDAAHKRATDNGATIVMGPMEVPGGQWIVQAVDPQKAFFAMVGPKKK